MLDTISKLIPIDLVVLILKSALILIGVSSVIYKFVPEPEKTEDLGKIKSILRNAMKAIGMIALNKK